MTLADMTRLLALANRGDERAIQHLAVHASRYGREYAEEIAAQIPAEDRPEFWDYFNFNFNFSR